MLKLVLRLLGLLSPLLFLNQCVSVLGGTLVLWWAFVFGHRDVLTMALSSLRYGVDDLLRLVVALWAILSRIKTLLLSHLSVNSVDPLLPYLLLPWLTLMVQKCIMSLHRQNWLVLISSLPSNTHRLWVAHILKRYHKLCCVVLTWIQSFLIVQNMHR